MTYNIRFDNPADGVNAWPNRKDKVASLIQKYDPHAVGIQEALHHQLQDLVRILPDYSIIGVGRDDGKEKGEYSAILYKHTRFGLLSSGTFWLSETPDVPGSKSWDAAITRLATWARLFDKELNTEIFLLNTHFDHVGKMARAKSAEMIKSRIAELSLDKPFVISGDFNCKPDEDPYKIMIGPEEPIFYDAVRGEHVGTFCGFEVGAMECVTIDYIFHSFHWKVRYQRVFNAHDGKYYPSDHLPVLAELELITEK